MTLSDIPTSREQTTNFKRPSSRAVVPDRFGVMPHFGISKILIPPHTHEIINSCLLKFLLQFIWRTLKRIWVWSLNKPHQDITMPYQWSMRSTLGITGVEPWNTLYIYIYIYIHTYTFYKRVYVHRHYTHTYTLYMCVCVCIHIIYIYIHLYTYIHVLYIYVCMCAYTLYKYIHIVHLQSRLIHLYIFTFILSFQKNKYQIHSNTSNMDDFKTFCIYENLPIFTYFFKRREDFSCLLKNPIFSNIIPRAKHVLNTF